MSELSALAGSEGYEVCSDEEARSELYHQQAEKLRQEMEERLPAQDANKERMNAE